MTAARPAREGELTDLVRVTGAAFGEQTSPERLQRWVAPLERDRAFVAEDDGTIHGAGAAFSLELTVPGQTTVAAGGLTYVGVLPTHRRRGTLRTLMAAHLEDCRDRSEPLSALTASEATIYGRFGYGIASHRCEVSVDTRAARIRDAATAGARLSLSDLDAAAAVMAQVHDTVRAVRTGEISRPPSLWRSLRVDLDDEVDGDHGWFVVLHDDANGEPDGYATYRVAEESWDGEVPGHTIDVFEISAAAPDVEAALWRYLTELDLATALRVRAVALDSPLRWWFDDPRRLRTTDVVDHLWLRMLDVPTCLRARRYVEGPTSLVLRAAGGDGTVTVRLEVDGDGAADATLTDDEPDLTMPVTALPALWLGTASATTLAHAGRLTAVEPRARTTADRMFRTSRLPFCATPF